MNASTKPSQVHHLESTCRVNDGQAGADSPHTLRDAASLSVLASEIVLDAIDASRDFVSRFDTRQQGE